LGKEPNESITLHNNPARIFTSSQRKISLTYYPLSFLAGIIKSTCALLDKPLISPPLAIELSGLSLPPAHLFVLLVPMFLLTFDGAVGRVPAAPVDRFSLAVEALKAKIIL